MIKNQREFISVYKDVLERRKTTGSATRKTSTDPES